MGLHAPPRVRLRRLAAEDVQAVHAILADPEACRFTPVRPASSPAAAHGFVALCQQQAALGSVHTFAVVAAEAPGELWGIIQASRPADDVELGCALARPHWGGRLMTEAMATLLRWISTTVDDALVWGVCDAAHAPARRMMEQVGFTLDRVLPNYRVHPALGPTPRDCVRYAAKLRSLLPSPGAQPGGAPHV